MMPRDTRCDPDAEVVLNQRCAAITVSIESIDVKQSLANRELIRYSLEF